jgi:hypothetical protein
VNLETSHPVILAEGRERELFRAVMRVKAARRRALPKLDRLSHRSPIVADHADARWQKIEDAAIARHTAARRRLRVITTEDGYRDAIPIFVLTGGTFERVLATLKRRRAAILYGLSCRGFVGAFSTDLEALQRIDGAIAAQDRLDPDSAIAKLRAEYGAKRARMLGAMCVGEITDDTIEFFAQIGALLRAIDLTPTDYVVEMLK